MRSVERATGPANDGTDQRLDYYGAPEHLRVPDSLDLMTQDEWDLANLMWMDDAGVEHAGVQPEMSDFANYNFDSGIGFGQGVDPDTLKGLDAYHGKVATPLQQQTNEGVVHPVNQITGFGGVETPERRIREIDHGNLTGVNEDVFDTYDPVTNTLGMSQGTIDDIELIGSNPLSESYDEIGGFHTTRPDSIQTGAPIDLESFGDTRSGLAVVPSEAADQAVDTAAGTPAAGTPAATANTGTANMANQQYNQQPLSAGSQQLLDSYGFGDFGDSPLMSKMGVLRDEDNAELLRSEEFYEEFINQGLSPADAQIQADAKIGNLNSRILNSLAYDQSIDLQTGGIAGSLGSLDTQEALSLRNYGGEQRYRQSNASQQMRRSGVDPSSSAYRGSMQGMGQSAAYGRADIQNQFSMNRVALAEDTANRLTALITGTDYSPSVSAMQSYNMGLRSGQSGVGSDPARLGSNNPSMWDYAATGATIGYGIGGAPGAFIGGGIGGIYGATQQ